MRQAFSKKILYACFELLYFLRARRGNSGQFSTYWLISATELHISFPWHHFLHIWTFTYQVPNVRISKIICEDLSTVLFYPFHRPELPQAWGNSGQALSMLQIYKLIKNVFRETPM